MLARWERASITALLWFEVIINAVSGLHAIVEPVSAVALMVGSSVSPRECELYRIFGAMIFTMGTVLLARCMLCKDRAPLKLLLEALLVGDVFYLAALTPFIRMHATSDSYAWLGAYVITAVLFVARLRYRLGDDWDGKVKA